MGTVFSLPLEIIGILMFFAMFWLLFFKLHYQESKTRRILLIICMVLYRPLLAIPLPMILRILFPFVMVAVLALLAGGRKKSVWITAVYFSGATVFIDAIATALVLGLTGVPFFSNNNFYFYEGISIYIALFLVVLTYYLIMMSTPQEAIDRIPLPIWIIILFIQPAGTAVFYITMDSLLMQLSAGYNNFLLLSSFLCIMLILSLVIFYFFIKFASGYSTRLLEGELNKAPPVYSPQSGLSPEFLEKYGLSSREAEITVALLGGKSDREIAVSLYIAVDTVKTHLKKIYRKTGAPGRYALMALIGNK
jgi:DNA-binding CsgD family transcriptional regulator